MGPRGPGGGQAAPPATGIGTAPFRHRGKRLVSVRRRLAAAAERAFCGAIAGSVDARRRDFAIPGACRLWRGAVSNQPFAGQKSLRTQTAPAVPLRTE